MGRSSPKPQTISPPLPESPPRRDPGRMPHQPRLLAPGPRRDRQEKAGAGDDHPLQQVQGEGAGAKSSAPRRRNARSGARGADGAAVLLTGIASSTPVSTRSAGRPLPTTTAARSRGAFNALAESR